MAIANPEKVPGSELAAYRDLYGVKRAAIARRLEMHRNTLAGWEASPEVDATRATQYRTAVDAIVRERLDRVRA